MRVSNVGDAGIKKLCEEETKSINDTVIFEKFKHTDQEQGEFIAPYCDDEGQCSVVNDVPESRKRKNPFEGWPSYPTILDLDPPSFITIWQCKFRKEINTN